MRSIRFIGIALLASSLLLLSGCSGGTVAVSVEPTPTPVLDSKSTQIIAEAKVVPVQSAALTFQTTGTVAEIMVHEGEHVDKDAPLARLNARDQELRVEQAKVDLTRARANYAQLVEGATPEAIAAAEAGVAQAEATLRQNAGSVTNQDVAAARSQLDAARTALARLEAGPKSTAVEQTRAARDQAQANLQAQRDSLSAAKTNAETQVQQAADALTQAQARYAQAKNNWDRIRDENVDPLNPKSCNQQTGQCQANRLNDAQRETYYAQYVQAEAAMHQAETSVQQAAVAVEQARHAEISGIQSAEAQVREAQAALDQLVAGADKDQLAAARAVVAQAQANLDKLVGEQRAGQLEGARAGVQNAQARLNQLTAKPRKTDLDMAQAQVTAAEIALQQAELELAHTTLRAPFAGTVAAINVDVGAIPSPEKSALVLADASAWQIETSDLTELNVVAIHEGDPVTITFDALPGVALAGMVLRVKPLGESYQGDMTYTVVVIPKQYDARLRWNMTATIAVAK
jgi:HlyD family secretion protein